MLNTSFQPMFSHLFSNESVKEMLNQCKLTTDDLATSMTKAMNDQFKRLNLQHKAQQNNHIITIFEIIPGEQASPQPYQISLFSYPEEIAGIPASMAENHALILLYAPEAEQAALTNYLNTLDNYGASLKPHSIKIAGKDCAIQILEQYYDFNVDTFNDYR